MVWLLKYQQILSHLSYILYTVPTATCGRNLDEQFHISEITK